MELPENWMTLPFPKAVKRVRSTGTKVRAGDYKPSGNIPVVDQGQKLVVGFTDDETTKFQGPLPVIVFGDHTREVKFVDFAKT
jgi:type I restriction enzyme S subunit